MNMSFDEVKKSRQFNSETLRNELTKEQIEALPIREVSNRDEIHNILGTADFNPYPYYPAGIELNPGEFGYDRDYRYVNPENIPQPTELEISARQIGDGKLPNKYWVSASNDYYYFNREEHAFDWISDKGLFPCRSKTLQVFDTYKEAKAYALDIHDTGLLYMPADKPEHFFYNTVSIEDRFTGQLFERSKAIDLQNGNIMIEEHEDTKYTVEALKKRGVIFK